MVGEWKNCRLGDVAKIQGGFAFKSKDFVESGVPVVKIKNVRKQNIDLSEVDCVSVDLAKKCSNFYVREGDVLISMTGSGINAPASIVGRVARHTGDNRDFLINQRVGRFVVCNDEKLDLRYLYYFFSRSAIQNLLVSIATGSANQVNISGKQIESVEIPLPPIKNQKVIAHILGSLDDKIEINRRMNTTLEAMAQALFKSWFVDFDPVVDNALAAGNPIPEPFHKRAEARRALGDKRKPLPADIAQHFPDRFVFNEEMGWVPDGWKICPLKSITTELRRGISPKYVDVGGVRVVNQKCIRDHTVNYCLTRRNDKSKRKINGRELMVGDVLVNSTGVGTLGRMAQILCLDETTVVDSHVTVVRSNNDIYKPYTFARMILSLEPKIEAMGEGSTGQTELSRANLQEITVLVPPLNCQKGIERILFNNAQKMVVLSKDNELLTSLRDTLLPKLLSGQLRIPNAENFFKAA